jgi:hypothetical protein
MITYTMNIFHNILFLKILFSLIFLNIFIINTKTADKVMNIKTPERFERTGIDEQNFASYLRQLPLKPEDTKVKYYNGNDKSNQNAHYRIIDLDIGTKNLQQCADAVIRLRAEYLFSIGSFESIHFNFTSGDTAKYADWIRGYRPQLKNNHVSWIKNAGVEQTYANFRKYLDTVFMYSGSYSLKKELSPVIDLQTIEIGNVFIQAGFPGHAIIVVDMVRSIDDDKIAILLAQSYMPAQDIHILVNENDPDLNPWYIVGQNDKLYTPEWIFEWSDLYKFK